MRKHLLTLLLFSLTFSSWTHNEILTTKLVFGLLHVFFFFLPLTLYDVSGRVISCVCSCEHWSSTHMLFTCCLRGAANQKDLDKQEGGGIWNCLWAGTKSKYNILLNYELCKAALVESKIKDIRLEKEQNRSF